MVAEKPEGSIPTPTSSTPTPTTTSTSSSPAPVCGESPASRTESKPVDIPMRSAAQHHHAHDDSSIRLMPKASKQMSFSESEIDRRRSLSESEEVSPQSEYDDNTYQKVLVSTKPIPIK